MKTDSIPKTRVELEQWLKDNCYGYGLYYYNVNEKNPVYEGYSIDYANGVYIWCFYDRSESEKIKSFRNEQDIVLYAFKEITGNSWAKMNLLGVFISLELKSILKSLKELKIAYITDEINYGKGDIRVRVFVAGCDIKKVTHLIRIEN